MPDFAESLLHIRDLDVRVLDSGGDGPAFVLVHGLGVSSYYFMPLAERLAETGRVVMLDLPGFGRTTTPDRDLRIPEFAAVAVEATERIGISDAVWVGHSMGTQVVVEALRTEPASAGNAASADIKWQPMAHSRLNSAAPPAKAALLIGPVVNRDERRTPQVVARFLQSVARESIPSAAASVVAWVRCGPSWFLRTFPAMMRYPIEQRIRDVHVPVYLMSAELDALAPEVWLRELADAAGTDDVVTRMVPNAAHQVMHSHADLVADVARGLADGRAQS